MRRVLKALVRLYQLTLSPYIGGQCRFEPTCSNYALQALDEHGAARGSWLSLRRLLRCHPFRPGGYDPVPPTHPRQAVRRQESYACSHGPSASPDLQQSPSQAQGLSPAMRQVELPGRQRTRPQEPTAALASQMQQFSQQQDERLQKRETA